MSSIPILTVDDINRKVCFFWVNFLFNITVLFSFGLKFQQSISCLLHELFVISITAISIIRVKLEKNSA